MASFLSVRAFFIAFGFTRATPTQDQCERAFESFIAEYNKTYHNAKARATAVDAFCESLAHVEAENSKQNNFTLTINEFADQTSDEWRNRSGFRMSTANLWGGAPHLGTDMYNGERVPHAIDWVQHGAVTHVKDQGHCGACWTFSTTGALEGAWKIASGSLVSMSEQQLMDCSHFHNGCRGGLPNHTFMWVEKNRMCTEASYKYTAKRGTCSEARCHVAIPAGKMVGFRNVAHSYDALLHAVSKQPVSIAVESEIKSFRLYSHGVFNSKCGTNIDHAVLLVGYGHGKGLPYWKVKNSWGAHWGENGYIRLVRGVHGGGQCGILLGASYPILKASNEVSSVVV